MTDGGTRPDSNRDRFHGRRRGRRLRPGRAALLETLLPRLRIAIPADGKIDPKTLFAGSPIEVGLEIGFGAGEHLASQARNRPDVGFIGCEPYVNGVAALLARIGDLGLTNIRIVDDDARPLLGVLADASIHRVFVLFSDPWPKTRHHRRRFIGDATVAALARVLADEGELWFATDDTGYVRWTLDHVIRNPAFTWTARRPEDWRCPPAGWVTTRYESKALARGAACVYLRFVRRRRADLPRIGKKTP